MKHIVSYRGCCGQFLVEDFSHGTESNPILQLIPASVTGLAGTCGARHGDMAEGSRLPGGPPMYARCICSRLSQQY